MDSISSDIFISVIIPTYNRSEMVGITIESFINQNYPKDKYEIIIVDNNSSDNTPEVIRHWQNNSSVPLKYLFEKRQGVHYARNKAFYHSKGDILYYTDDDMIADVNLLKEIVMPFTLNNLVASVTGRVLPKWEENPPQWILDYCLNGWLSLHDRREYLLISPYDCGVFSCHQAMRRDAFAQSGGFNPENTAGEWIGDGETGLNIKLKELGYWFGYIGSSVTYHMIPPQRMTQYYFNKRMANQGNCDSYTDYRRYLYTRPQLIKKIISHAKWACRHSLKYLVRYVLRKESWRLHRAQVNYYSNRIRYDIRLLHDEKWRDLVLKRDWLNESDYAV